MASSLSFNIDNPNLHILQDKKAINRVVPPLPKLVLANEIQANYEIRRETARIWFAGFWLHILDERHICMDSLVV